MKIKVKIIKHSYKYLIINIRNRNSLLDFSFLGIYFSLTKSLYLSLILAWLKQVVKVVEIRFTENRLITIILILK